MDDGRMPHEPVEVVCYECGRYVPTDGTERIDVSLPDEFYPDVRHLCRNCRESDDHDRGDGIETDGGEHDRSLAVERYTVDRAASVAYGPLGVDSKKWELRFGTDDGTRVVVRLDRASMYELWTEVRGVPWPSVSGDPERRQRDELVRELVERANVAGESELREALAALGGDERVE